MSRKIKTVYVVHHSHTDIGYTDLQERVINTQVNYIRTALKIMGDGGYNDFRWNCETLFCVEEFFKVATEKEKQQFCSLIKENVLGMSANYLNFNDIVDSDILHRRVSEWQQYFAQSGVNMYTAMTADINGISMGQRDAMLDNGVEFLFTNVHCHHGLYPLYQNQNAFFWENAAGKRMLVWNGEHYNLGNVLGIKPNRTKNFMMENHMGQKNLSNNSVEIMKDSLHAYLDLCEENSYEYDFIVSSVSGVFSDNAPPELEILETIRAYNALYGEEVNVRMVSLQELYAGVKDKLQGAPVYRGDLTDWWADGAGSTPYAVKHYRDAQHRYNLCRRLDAKMEEKYPELARDAQDNLLIYAEHTWGHSATITNPYDTMVLNLDMRKNSYASKAHEAASKILTGIAEENGDIMRYYSTNGEVLACSVSSAKSEQLVEFYIESPVLANAEIKNASGEVLTCQVSPHPRGRKISFTDSFAPYERKNYTYTEIPAVNETLNSRKAYVGSERVRDIVNSYDPATYLLPYEFENKWFRLAYSVGTGVTDFIDKRNGKSLIVPGTVPLFTPMYEHTAIEIEYPDCPSKDEQGRRLLGRNIRGENATMHVGELKKISVSERGKIFTILKLEYNLAGSIHSCVFLKFFNDIPRIDFKLELGKTISTDIENVFLPLSLNYSDAAMYLRKGGEAFRPGVDQVPGTCMEYYVSDEGLAYAGAAGGAMIATRDTPLVYMGGMCHHPITLCDSKEENNHRTIYSWLMNNKWETNFKMDLSGFSEFCYTMWLSDETDGEKAMNELKELCYDPFVLIVK